MTIGLPYRGIALALLVVGSAVAPAEAKTVKNFQAVWGASFKGDSYTTSASLSAKLGGDISTDGWLLRFGGYFGQYSYDTSAVPGGVVDVDSYAFNALVGYQIISETVKYSIYMGLDYQDREGTPDNPSSPTNGSKTGFRIMGDLRTRGDGPISFSLLGNYSTAHDSYLAQARLGFAVMDLSVGPEVMLLGNTSYDAQQIGLFVGGIDLGPVNLTLRGGYSFSGGGGDDGRSGPYGGVSSSMQF